MKSMSLQKKSNLFDKQVVGRHLIEPDYTDWGVFFMNYNKLLADIRDKRTHVLLASGEAINSFLKQTPFKSRSVRISNDKYFDTLYGQLMSKQSKNSIIQSQFKSMY